MARVRRCAMCRCRVRRVRRSSRMERVRVAPKREERDTRWRRRGRCEV
jgi:hypothetical protein